MCRLSTDTLQVNPMKKNLPLKILAATRDGLVGYQDERRNPSGKRYFYLYNPMTHLVYNTSPYGETYYEHFDTSWYVYFKDYVERDILKRHGGRGRYLRGTLICQVINALCNQVDGHSLQQGLRLLGTKSPQLTLNYAGGYSLRSGGSMNLLQFLDNLEVVGASNDN